MAGLGLAPRTTLITLLAIVSLAFLVSVVFKFVVCMVGVRQENHVQVTDEEVAALDPADLPVYTVLVPVFREANIVAQLIGNLGGLDYPAEKLEILLLLEESDTETIEAAKAADPPKKAVVAFRRGGDRLVCVQAALNYWSATDN